MSIPKDNFSAQASEYAMFRPGYPVELYEFILSLTVSRNCALDIATGNGQVAAALSQHFEKVYAIDISEKQIQNSIQKQNVFYSLAPAEQTGFENNQFDLITVGQAAHWFRLPEFYNEVQRILKPNGVLALFGYTLPVIDETTDAVVMELYEGLLGSFWDPERKLVDARYKTLSYPFNKLAHPDFKMEYYWSISQLLGFLGTWSAVQHYKKKLGADPMDLITEKLKTAWGDESVKKITFPVFLLATKFQ